MNRKNIISRKTTSEQWKDARRICRINSEDIRLAKELSLTPEMLISHAPNKSEKWKMSVKEYIRMKAAEKQ